MEESSCPPWQMFQDNLCGGVELERGIWGKECPVSCFLSTCPSRGQEPAVGCAHGLVTKGKRVCFASTICLGGYIRVGTDGGMHGRPP